MILAGRSSKQATRSPSISALSWPPSNLQETRKWLGPSFGGEIHHQGDVGEGSFAAVPHLVRIHRARGVVDPNTYAMVTTIELARSRDENPEVPEWARTGYHEALVDLEGLAVQDIRRTTEPEAVQYILAFLALARGRREYARLLCDYSEAELVDFERQAT